MARNPPPSPFFCLPPPPSFLPFFPPFQLTHSSPLSPSVAPMKALCSERYNDWQAKFGPLGLHCCELTGDSQLDDYFELQNAQIVMTTPVSHTQQ